MEVIMHSYYLSTGIPYNLQITHHKDHEWENVLKFYIYLLSARDYCTIYVANQATHWYSIKITCNLLVYCPVI